MKEPGETDKKGAEGAAETLRQKDRFRTKLWKAKRRRSNPTTGESFRFHDRGTAFIVVLLFSKRLERKGNNGIKDTSL